MDVFGKMKSITKLKDVALGDFIKVSQTNGPTPDRISLAGKVVMLCLETNRLEIQTMDGTIGIGWKMDGVDLDVSKLAQKPRGWAAHMKNPNQPRKKPTIVKSKKVLIFEFVESNPRKKLPGLLALAKREIGGDELILESYIQLALLKLKRLNPVK